MSEGVPANGLAGELDPNLSEWVGQRMGYSVPAVSYRAENSVVDEGPKQKNPTENRRPLCSDGCPPVCSGTRTPASCRPVAFTQTLTDNTREHRELRAESKEPLYKAMVRAPSKQDVESFKIFLKKTLS